MKKTAVILLSLILMFFSQTAFALPADDTEKISVNISVEERNGINLTNHFERRGVPFAKGQVTNINNLKMVDDNDAEVPFTPYVLENYDDGSVKWLLASWVMDLKPYEHKNYRLINGRYSREKSVKVFRYNNSMVIGNENISVNLGYNGISKCSYLGNEKVDDGNINIYVQTDNTVHEMSSTKFEIIKDEGIYAKVKISGKITDNVLGEMTVTLSKGSELVDIEYRITALGNVTIQSTGIIINNVFKNLGNEIDNGDYIDMNNIGVISVDNTRFSGAIVNKSNTGFVKDGNTLFVAPILNNASFMWYDGVSRTNHLYLNFESNSRNMTAALKKAPAIVIDKNQYLRAGIINSTEMPLPARTMISAVHYARDKRDNRFEAGSIPYTIEVELDSVTDFNHRPGEVEYYLGYGYMALGDTTLYEMIMESVESWADVVIYKGQYETPYGLNRYFTGGSYGQDRFFISQPYYGCLTGLYTAYVFSGNEYLKDTFKIGADGLCRIMNLMPNSGVPYPRLWLYGTYPEGVGTKDGCEPRYLIQTQAMLRAYQVFGDEKYKTAVGNFLEWAVSTQTDDGYWYQLYGDDKIPGCMSGQDKPSIKNYIYLYGLRGITDILSEIDDKDVHEMVRKCADYLCYENEQYGPGLWHPFGNKDMYEVNEDGTRGKSPMSDIMAADVLLASYKDGGSTNDRYLKNMMSLLDSFVCAQSPEGTSEHKIGQEGYELPKVYAAIGQCLTLLHSGGEFMELIDSRKDDVIDWGYENLIVAFSENAKKYDKSITVEKYSWPDITVKAYTDGVNTQLYGMNLSGYVSGDFTKNICINIGDSGIWSNYTNITDNPYNITLNIDDVKQFELIKSAKLPIYIDKTLSEVKVKAVEYSEERIVLEILGDGLTELRLEDGKFNIAVGGSYSIVKTDINGGVRITVTKGGSYTCSDDKLTFRVSLSDGYSDTDNMQMMYAVKNALFNNRAEETVSAGVFLDAVQNVSGYTEINDDLSDFVTVEKASETLIKLICEEYPEFAKENGIAKTEFTMVPQANSDEDAVKYAAQALEIRYDGSKLSSDVDLPSASLYDTKVQWISDNPEILGNDGVLKRYNISNSNVSVTLTASVSKGDAVYERQFTVPIAPVERDTLKSSTEFKDSCWDIIPQAKAFELEHTLEVNNDSIDVVIGVANKGNSPSQMADFPIIARFPQSGVIDAYDELAYRCENSIRYHKGEKYKIRFVVRPETSDYDVYVTPGSDKEILVAAKCRFRVSAPLSDEYNAIYTVDSWDAGGVTVLSNSIRDFEKSAKVQNLVYDESGYVFGKYLTNNLKLSSVDDNSRISWLSVPNGIIDNNLFVRKRDEFSRCELFSVKDDERKIQSFTDLAKHLGIVQSNCEGSDAVDTYKLADMVSNLDWIRKAYQK